MAATATEASGRTDRPGHRITTLDSGVRIVTERISQVRSVALGFLMDTGSAGESEQQAGISHLLEHMLFRGSSRYASEEIDQIFDGMGAELNAGTDKESTSVYTRVLDGHIEKAFDVISDMVFRPRFEGLDAEREVVLEEIAMYEDDPQDRVFEEISRAVFGSHPLGRPVIGTAEAVSAVTREQLHEYRNARYTPDSVVIAAAGSVDHERLVELARAAEVFDADPPAKDSSAAAAAAAAAPFAPRRRFLRKDTEQFHVCVGGAGLARDDERRYALRVLEGIFGGTSSSRLFQEIRERRGLAYSVFTYSNLFAGTGEVGLYVGTRPENLSEAIEVAARELQRCVEDPAGEAELVRSRENLKGRIVLSLESTGARMGRLGGAILTGMPILSVDEVIERIDAVEIDDLRGLAAELFAPERLAVAGVGPDSKRFADAIAPLGDGEPTVEIGTKDVSS